MLSSNSNTHNKVDVTSPEISDQSDAKSSSSMRADYMNNGVITEPENLEDIIVVDINGEITTEEDVDASSSPIQLMSIKCLAIQLVTNLHLHNLRESFGLTELEGKERLLRNRSNQLTPRPERSLLLKYLLEFTDPFMMLLILAGVLSCVAYRLDTSQQTNLWIGLVIFVVVIISSTFTFIQEGKATAVMKAFKKMLPKQCHVIREGHLHDMKAIDLVVGDVISVTTGDQIPADIRLIYVNNLKVENSSLTGESQPISCALATKETKIEEARNICFSTSQCVEGEAIGVVYATGDQTHIGQIARLATDTGVVDTPLQTEVKQFVKKLAILSFMMGVIFFIIGVARGQPIITAFVNGFIVVMIANVPEGLPVTVITVLTISGKRLSKLNVFVKQLGSVETLGSVTVIATDKTGTLTENKMSVSRLWFDMTPTTVPALYAQTGQVEDPEHIRLADSQTLRKLEIVCAVNSRARFDDHRDLTDEEVISVNKFDALDDIKRKVIGDSSETALFNFIRARQSIELLRYHNRVVFEVPFNSGDKFTLTIHKPHNMSDNTDHRRILTMKGAPEVVLSRCDRWMNQGNVSAVDADFKKSFQLMYESFAGFGERVLGFAQLEMDETHFPSDMDIKYNQDDENYPTTNLVFLGLISLADPPKESVPGAIAICRRAGIRVMMVTGDHPLTAIAIARMVGIITYNTRDELAKLQECPASDIPEKDVNAIVVTGTEIDSFGSPDWDRVLIKKEVIFARTTPAQKLSIVSHLQRLGEIVAATGDGVNDSPALKKADIGVAMGISGSDVARDAGDVILMDDNFSSIVVGIKEGRTIFDNLTKSIAYTITHMPPEVIPILLNLAFGFPLGLNAILILCIDCGTELAPSVSLAYESAERDVMSRPPRNSKVDHLVSLKTLTYWYLMAGAWETLSCLLIFFLIFNHFGVAPHLLPFSDNFWKESGTNDPLCIDGAYYSGHPEFYNTQAICPNGQLYTDDDQKQILAYAQTGYWITLTGTQVFHIFMCKTRVLSVFQQGMWNNRPMIYSVCIEIGIIVFVVFVPAHSFLNTGIFPGIYWLTILVGWGGIFLLNEPRKYFIRNYPKNPVVDFLAW